MVTAERRDGGTQLEDISRQNLQKRNQRGAPNLMEVSHPRMSRGGLTDEMKAFLDRLGR